MEIQELVPVGSKTTMRIGGRARVFAVTKTREDVEEAVREAVRRKLPLFVLGGGSNTVFADGIVDAFILRIGHDAMQIEDEHITVGAGCNLAILVNALAERGLDLSAFTGIPGTVGGAIFGNAGQGPAGVWIGGFVASVTAFVDGRWNIFSQEECHFRYRESMFKESSVASHLSSVSRPIIWEATLRVSPRLATEVKTEIDRLLQKRLATQPHCKTAGSCFKALPDGTPAWRMIDAAGLRGLRIGDIEVAQKHANFLLNAGNATYADAVAVVQRIRGAVPHPLDVEMRFVENDGAIAF